MTRDLARPTVLAAALVAALPMAAAAHPHVYIDAALVLDYDAEGRLTGVEVEWAYDELYSLLIIEDYGLDPDGDGVLTAEENAVIQGFDGDWEEGFDGRLFLQQDGQPVAMAQPADFTAEYRDGRLISRHLHPLATPLEGNLPLALQVYDPEYYVAFSMPAAPETRGRDDCRVERVSGDPEAAADAYLTAVETALDSGDADNAELVIVDIGATGADGATINCGDVP